jgi:hypothetical protein
MKKVADVPDTDSGGTMRVVFTIMSLLLAITSLVTGFMGQINVAVMFIVQALYFAYLGKGNR